MHSLQAGQVSKFQVLKDVFGFQTFRPGQEDVIDAIYARENVLAVMPTGFGKSLCYQVPAVGREGLTIVVSPLVALMQDQVAALKLAGVAAETINSSLDRGANVAAWLRVAKGEANLLYLSPERLMTERMLSALKKLPVSLFVVDEAHCISQWGPAFRPEYEMLSQLRSAFPDVSLAAFTATADEATRQDIMERLFGGKALSFVLGFDRPNIKLSVKQRQDGRQQSLSFIRDHNGESGIVYCLSRKKTEDTAAFLVQNGIKALPYHAGMDAQIRKKNQDTFMTEEGVVMVATIAFGMGIDKPDVRFVLHSDLPGTMEAYYQEFGRAGRDGLPADVLMLYGLGDLHTRRMFIEEEDTTDERKQRQHKRLDALLAYCESAECRRIPLLAYFGEQAKPCGNCDTCITPIETKDGAIEGKMALDAVRDTGQRFGQAHLIDVLRGTETDKVRDQNHHVLNIFGAGHEFKKREWQAIIRQLVAGEFLRKEMEQYGGLKITQKGKELTEGKAEFRYRMDNISKEPRTRGKARPVQKTVFSPADQSLFQRLKELRLELAQERNVPAFVIFPDRTLTEMVKNQPGTPAEFAQIHGVGANKQEAFAAPFLAVISAHMGD